ncbi:MAG: DNA primase, partial [Gemmiger sp.]|nr:DNA primase [Gemmiger sp.]
VRKISNLGYVEAVKALASRAGMPLPEEDEKEGRARSRLLEINRCAARYFFEQLNAQTPEAGEARRYWKQKRGLSDAAIRKFGLGYAPESFNGLLHYLKHRGFAEEELETSGLIKRSAKGNLYDIFRHRVMVPIIDIRGNIIAFGGRVLDDTKPKYINSPETLVYKKSRTLFALNVAKKSPNKRYILCEGYMDVISMHVAGFDTAVCACGTALTPEQVHLIGEYADEVILSYDSDEAGQKATQRSLGLFSGSAVKVSVLSIPGAKDPDEFIKKYGHDRFEALLNGTANPVEFALSKAKAGYDLATDDGRLEYIRQAIQILAGHVSPTARDVYAGRIAGETGVTKTAILNQLETAVRAAGRKAIKKEQSNLATKGIAASFKVPYDKGGDAALGAASAGRQLLAAIVKDKALIPYVRERLNLEDLVLPEIRHAIEAVYRCADHAIEPNLTGLAAFLTAEERAQVAQVLAQNGELTLTAQDVDMYLGRVRKAVPKSTEAAKMTGDELESYIAALKREKAPPKAEE